MMLEDTVTEKLTHAYLKNSFLLHVCVHSRLHGCVSATGLAEEKHSKETVMFSSQLLDY